ncbi:MAG: hypothetical protein F6J97_09805 [Leptolyngbya sp. SIO4C1]|nr:hypothetical protein [Leptolyngbya sp. SIO4C1]
MDFTLLALLILSVVLIGLHAPYAALTLAAIILLSTVVTRLSWAVLQSFETAEVTQRIWD